MKIMYIQMLIGLLKMLLSDKNTKDKILTRLIEVGYKPPTTINELIDMVDNPTATGMVITRAFSKDFKYSQTLRMIVIDSKAKTLGYQIYEFDIKNYEKINMESIQGYLVNILKKILNSKNV